MENRQTRSFLTYKKLFFFLLFLALFYIILDRYKLSISMTVSGNVYTGVDKRIETNTISESNKKKLLNEDLTNYERIEFGGKSTIPQLINGKTYIGKITIEFENTKKVANSKGFLVDLKDVQRSNRNVFFVESRCATNQLFVEANSGGSVMLNPRQCCAVESTAMTNPGRQVYVLHSCPLADDFLLDAPEYVRKILERPNVHLVKYNMTEVFRATPVENLVASGRLEKSDFPVEHASDVLRLTMLWKFGGTYCDMDVVTIRSLDELNSNFCGLANNAAIGNGVLNFEPDGPGHDILTRVLQHVNGHFDGTQWTANGPDLVTRFILEACNATLKTVTDCQTFTVFNHTVLYPLRWWEHEHLFDASLGPELLHYVQHTAHIVHVWNKQSHDIPVPVGSSLAYGLLADQYCHDVYTNCGPIF